MSLAKRIAACRKQAGLSQEKLAERMGVSRQTISRWETREARPDLEKFEQLCGVFSVSADALLFGAQSQAQPDGREQSRRAKAHFRMAAAVVLAAAGVLLVLGIGMAGAGGVCIAREYRRL